MYNMIFGESKNADALLKVLGLIRDSFYRYRDCYLDEKGNIAVYTRGGGNNRECYCDDDVFHDDGCVVELQDRNINHPCYLFDKDDDFDNTYATFYFRIPEEADRDSLANIEPEIARDDAWMLFLNALKESNKGKN